MLKQIALVCGLAMALSVLAAAAVVISPKSFAKADSPAVVITDSVCMFLDGNGSLVLASDSQAVITDSGNSKITCTGQVTPSSTAQGAVHWNLDNTSHLLCHIPSGEGEVGGLARRGFFPLTPDWEEVVTPSGQATLSCHINGSSS
jgi:hypothetical protein